MRQFDIRGDSLLRQSRYDMANLFNVYSAKDDNYYFNINRTVVVKGLDNPLAGVYDLYQVMLGDHWTTISFKFYNTIELWWLICKFNSVRNPTVSPVEGDVIKIPVVNIVNGILDGIKTN